MHLLQRVLELNRTAKAALISVSLLVLLILIYPFQSTTVPPWSFRVVDNMNRPVSRINVTQHWQHYLVENQGHDELKTTDDLGAVSFPGRVVRASILTRLSRTLRSFGRTGDERRRDPYASIVIWGNKNYDLTTSVADLERALPDTIVVHARF